MKKNTAILLVIGLAGVGAYFIFRKKQPVQSLKVQSSSPKMTEQQRGRLKDLGLSDSQIDFWEAHPYTHQ